MSIIEKLSEGIINRDMKAEGNALLSKWSSTGLLEGLETQRQQATMARLLENQAKELLREASTLAAGDVEGFAAVAFPIVRRVFAGLIANDLVSVQPMSLPSGLIFFLDFKFGEDGASPRMGNVDGKSIYGTNEVGASIIDGVNLLDADTKAGYGGPGRDGSVGYAFASPSGSNTTALPADANCKTTVFKLDGSVSQARMKYIQYDPDLLSLTGTEKGIIVIDVEKTVIIDTKGDPDFDNVSAFVWANLANADVAGVGADTDLVQIRRLTRVVSASEALTDAESVRFVWSIIQSAITEQSTTSDNMAATAGTGDLTFPIKDQIDASTTVGAVVGDLFPMEAEAGIPEIDIDVSSTAITAQTKKLKAKWTPELGQDLNAYHNIDAEVELTSILSEQIALEIDREILADLVNGATAATYYWSRSPGLFVNKSTGAELGAASAAPDFTGTVSEWYETLIETINDVSAQIHRKTLRGGANYVVCSPEAANILEFTSGFRANVTADADKGDIGALKTGSLSRKFDVIVDPYFPRNVILVGRKGGSFLESGYVYAPYVPLQVTPTIFGPEDFVPRKGVMTRYAKKMVRSDMYGIVIIRGLLGEEGSS